MSRPFDGATYKLLIVYFNVFILFTFYTVWTASANRGDELLSKVQSDSLISHVTALQENVSYFPNELAYRTRSAHHREATDNVVDYIKTKLHRFDRLEVSEQILVVFGMLLQFYPQSRLHPANVSLLYVHITTPKQNEIRIGIR